MHGIQRCHGLLVFEPRVSVQPVQALLDVLAVYWLRAENRSIKSKNGIDSGNELGCICF